MINKYKYMSDDERFIEDLLDEDERRTGRSLTPDERKRNFDTYKRWIFWINFTLKSIIVLIIAILIASASGVAYNQGKQDLCTDICTFKGHMNSRLNDENMCVCLDEVEVELTN